MVAESKTLFGESAASAETIFTLPVIALVAITLLNDGLIISICKDKVFPAPKPQAWFLREIFSIAVTLGFCLVVSNCTLLLVGLNAGPGATAGSGCGQFASDYPYVRASERRKEKRGSQKTIKATKVWQKWFTGGACARRARQPQKTICGRRGQNLGLSWGNPPPENPFASAPQSSRAQGRPPTNSPFLLASLTGTSTASPTPSSTPTSAPASWPTASATPT
jgi:hypothetical protein